MTVSKMYLSIEKSEVDMLFKRSILILLSFLMLLTPILIDANDLKDRELPPYLKERYQTRGIGTYYSNDSLLVISVSPKLAADRDAGMDPEGGVWFGGGCLLGILVMSLMLHTDNIIMSGTIFGGTAFVYAGIANSFTPKAEVSKLIGKPPEYIDTYTKEYKRMVGKLQAQDAFQGYISGVGIPFSLIVFYILYCLMFNPNCGAY